MAGFNHFPKIAAALRPAVSQVVRKTAFDGQANIQGFIRANGQIDIGFMLGSVYTVTSEGSTYGDAGEPPGDSYLLPEVEAPENDLTAYIAVGANYGIYQNYGTRYLPPRPFFEPGIEQTRAGFDAALSAIEAKLRGVI